MTSQSVLQSGWRLGVKRSIDVAVALFGLVLLLPLMGVIMLAIWVTLGAPILFRQQRAGRDGSPFNCFKFRTMTEERDDAGRLLPDDARVTRLGKALRTTSLDELPQLWNVLSGSLSLVGPRPLPVRYLARYTKEQNRRHEVVPGITGWAQVQGRNAVTWPKKFELDVWYVDNWSLWLDIRILLLTVKVVLFREGVQADEQITMPEFMGTSGPLAADPDVVRGDANASGRHP